MAYAGKIYGKYLQTDNYKLKVYSKYLQMKIEGKSLKSFSDMYPLQLGYLKNTLRIELQVLKNRYTKLQRPISFTDISQTSFISEIYEDLVSKIKSIQFYKGYGCSRCFTTEQLLSYALFSHNNHELATQLKEENYQKFRYYKRLFKCLPETGIEELENKLKLKITRLIK